MSEHKAPSAVEDVPTQTPENLVVKMEVEYDTQTGQFRMRGIPANAVLALGIFEMAKETVMRSRLKAEIAHELLTQNAAAEEQKAKLFVPPPKKILTS